MRVIAALVAAIVAVAVTASSSFAQVVVSHFDKVAIGLGEGTLWENELDGIASTHEAIQFRANGQIRGVAIRNGAICTGEWFTPSAVVPLMPGDQLKIVGLLAVNGIMMVVGDGQQSHTTIRILYGCESGTVGDPPPPQG